MLIQINIDTHELSEADKEILAFLGGSKQDFVVHRSPEEAYETGRTRAQGRFTKDSEVPEEVPVEEAPKAEEEEEEEEEAPAEEAPKAKAKPAPAKAKPAPAKKEEPVEEPKPAAKKAAPAGDGPTMAQAVEIATKLVSENKTAEVKAALQSQGVRRVSELKDSEQIAAFIEAVEAI